MTGLLSLRELWPAVRSRQDRVRTALGTAASGSDGCSMVDMDDLVYVAITVAFFVAAFFLVKGLDRL